MKRLFCLCAMSCAFDMSGAALRSETSSGEFELNIESEQSSSCSFGDSGEVPQKAYFWPEDVDQQLLLVMTFHGLDFKSVRQLIQKGAKVNIQTRSGQTPLHLAILEGDRETVKWLLRHPEIDIDIPDKKGDKPACYARAIEKEDILNMLVEHKHIRGRRFVDKISIVSGCSALKPYISNDSPN